MMKFAERCLAACQTKGSYLCVGLDPRLDYIPPELVDAHGNGAAALEVFSKTVIDVIFDIVAVVKPQIAFFEALGPPGLQAFWNVVDYAHQHRLIVVADVKRGDIDTTAAAYASTFFHAKGVDAVTLNPYMGWDSIRPFLTSDANGVFILVKTSNPSSADFQDLMVGTRPLYEHVADKITEWAGPATTGRYSSLGAVIGATHPTQLQRLRTQLPRSIILVPGVGTQGGTVEDAALAFDADGSGALVNVSRGVLYPWLGTSRSSAVDRDWRAAIRSAAIRWNQNLASAIEGRRQCP